MDTVDTRSASVPEYGEKIIEIQLERLRTFKNHPFKIRMDQEMMRLSASVEKYGIINPLIVRPIPDGVYEIISGHRRKAAAEKFGYRKVPVIIRVMSDNEAVINMVDSNLQRQQITFSEKAFAYKMIDADPQGSLTASLGYVEPDEIGTTLATIMMAIINEKEFEITDGILHHKENVDLLPANIELSALEVTMGNVMSRELIMKEYIEAVRTEYDYILIDCMPSLGLMTINALVAADSVLIPVQAAYLPVKGLQQLIHTIAMVKKRLNRKLIFEGILLTMVDFRTNYAKDVAGKVREAYGEKIEIFDTVIPMSVKAAETSAEGVSIFSHCLNGKVAKAYETIAKEVLRNEE